jgi:hypothetical protein
MFVGASGFKDKFLYKVNLFSFIKRIRVVEMVNQVGLCIRWSPTGRGILRLSLILRVSILIQSIRIALLQLQTRFFIRSKYLSNQLDSVPNQNPT